MTFAGNYTDKFDWQKLYGTHRQALEATEFIHVQPEHVTPTFASLACERAAKERDRQEAAGIANGETVGRLVGF